MGWAVGDGFTDYGRNCGCGAGVYVLVDEFHGKCGVCGSEKLTQAGMNERDKDVREEMFAKMQKERDEANG